MGLIVDCEHAVNGKKKGLGGDGFSPVNLVLEFLCRNSTDAVLHSMFGETLSLIAKLKRRADLIGVLEQPVPNAGDGDSSLALLAQRASGIAIKIEGCRLPSMLDGPSEVEHWRVHLRKEQEDDLGSLEQIKAKVCDSFVQLHHFIDASYQLFLD